MSSVTSRIYEPVIETCHHERRARCPVLDPAPTEGHRSPLDSIREFAAHRVANWSAGEVIPKASRSSAATSPPIEATQTRAVSTA
jgi:hypothetical protein